MPVSTTARELDIEVVVHAGIAETVHRAGRRQVLAVNGQLN